MYKIIEIPNDLLFEKKIDNETIIPKILILDEESKDRVLITTFNDNQKYILWLNKNGETNWDIMVSIFDKYFMEVLRLLPENPSDLELLNEDYYKSMLELWQSEENYSLNKDILEFDSLIESINEKFGEKKGV